MNPLEELANQILLDLTQGRLTQPEAQAALEKAGVHPALAREMINISQGKSGVMVFGDRLDRKAAELAREILLDFAQDRLTEPETQAALEKAGVSPAMARDLIDVELGNEP